MPRMNTSEGFTIIELMITIAILGILAAIAIPSYQNYTRRAYYSEVVAATSPYKTAVEECYKKVKKLAGCNGGTNAIPANVTAPHGALATLTVVNGVITATPVAHNGILATDNYILIPTVTSTGLTWASSGDAVTNAYAN